MKASGLRAVLAIFLASTAFFVACGPEGGCGAQQPQNQLTCGRGTVQRGNQCVPR